MDDLWRRINDENRVWDVHDKSRYILLPRAWLASFALLVALGYGIYPCLSELSQDAKGNEFMWSGGP